MMLGTIEQLTVNRAREVAAQKAAQVADGRNPQDERRSRRGEPTIENLWEHWLLHAEAHKKPVSVYEDKLKYNKFLKRWAKRRLSTIRKADVQALHARIGAGFEEKRKNKTVRRGGPYQANRVLALLRSMFNKADELGCRVENPCKGVKMFRETARDRFMQPGELKAFFAALAAEAEIIQHFYLMLLLTGARRSNVEGMRWADVDLGAAYWRIPDTKAHIPVVVPLVPAAVTILTARAENANGCDWVFPGRNGEHIANPKDAWTRIVTKAGIPDVRPHDCRRSLGSYMAITNTSLPIIGKALGHKTAVATMVYSRLSLDPVREAMEKATATMLTAGGLQKLLAAPAKGESNG